MKVYISMDAEGISGIYNFPQVLPEGEDYELSRKLMAGDINAAARGAFDAGATEVFVNDAHNTGTNLIITDLDERILLCSGGYRPLSMVQGVERGYDVALFIGYHTPRGVKGVISHSYAYSSMVEMCLNDRIISEFELNGYVCGSFGTPVIYVSGDDQLVNHVQQIVPGIHSTITKECISDNAAVCKHPAVTSRMIYEEVKLAVSQYPENPIAPLKIEGGVRLDVRFFSEAQASLAARTPGTKRLSSHTVRFLADNYLEAYKSFLIGISSVSTFKA